MAFGVYPLVSLAEARVKRDDAKKLIAQGTDPEAERKDHQAKKVSSFEQVARNWHSGNKRWSDDHSERVIRSLEQYIFPEIGDADISSLKTSQLLVPVKSVDAEGKHDIARR